MSVLQGEEYITCFDCRAYLREYFSSPFGSADEKGAQNFQLAQENNFYAKYNAKWDKRNARVLEFGGGPVIKNLIGAAPFVQEIVFAAYTESERREVELWKDNKQGAHDWSPFFQYVVNELEGKEGEAVWQEREALLRSQIKAIIACDITQEYPLMIKQEPFDIVSTSLCLEAACKSYDEYKTAVKKLGSLLKPGGFMIMTAVERETFYMAGGKRWFCLSLTLAQIREALELAGFVILEAERDPAPIEQINNPTVSDYKALLFVAAQKVE